MCAAKHSTAKGHSHDSHGEHPNHGTLKGYLIGFFLAVNLTVIPFWLVMGRPLEGVFQTHVPVAILLMLFAVVQMVVHMIYFLHMHPKSEGGWTMMALFFTLILVVIVMSGSMWVMFHLTTNMMPAHDMSKMDATGESWVPSQQVLPPVPALAPTAAPTEQSPTEPVPQE